VRVRVILGGATTLLSSCRMLEQSLQVLKTDGANLAAEGEVHLLSVWLC
jgi:hypothetical protein